MSGLEICVCFVDKAYLFSQVFKGVLRQSDGFGYVLRECYVNQLQLQSKGLMVLIKERSVTPRVFK
jgi:hypothetical protein